jgi:hypothetical protein
MPAIPAESRRFILLLVLAAVATAVWLALQPAPPADFTSEGEAPPSAPLTATPPPPTPTPTPTPAPAPAIGEAPPRFPRLTLPANLAIEPPAGLLLAGCTISTTGALQLARRAELAFSLDAGRLGLMHTLQLDLEPPPAGVSAWINGEPIPMTQIGPGRWQGDFRLRRAAAQLSLLLAGTPRLHTASAMIIRPAD